MTPAEGWHSTDDLRRLCIAEPGNAELWSQLAFTCIEDGSPVEAEEALRTALAANPEEALLHFNLGCLLRTLNRHDEAEIAFERTCALAPGDQEAWFNLGTLRYARAAHHLAADAFLRAARLGGDGGLEAKRLAGFALADSGLPADAEVLLTEVAVSLPEGAEDLALLSQLLYCRLELCDWRDFSALATRCRQLAGAGVPPVEPFSFLLLPDISAAEQRALSENFCRRLEPADPLTPLLGRGERRLRLGYLGDVFQEHATARLAAGVIEQQDREEFAIEIFSYGPADDGVMRSRFVAACDVFHDVGNLIARDLAAFIRARGVDILVDLNGWTGNTRSAVLAWRPAAVQVNWLGYPATLGSRKFADYLIGDGIVTPLSMQHCYAETLALMPNCYQPNDRSRPLGPPPGRAEAGLPSEGLVFCCFNRYLKITPEVFDLWCEILRRVPGAILWLIEGNAAAMVRLRARAGEYGIAAGRLVFAPPLQQDAHLARLALADIVLDTYPYGAHTTASDALWVGVPVLTRIGGTFSSRVAASLLQAVHMEELVTSSPAEYVDRAVALAADAPARVALRARLAEQRLTVPLFDTARFARDFDLLLKAIWQNHESDASRPLHPRN